ncbi:hypothetical protein ACOSP7_001494 [Xanthoceras sorbifolium]|uniref:SHSP domain-containing protein n=1 Tax=Xanthoceras sorbifolium TaxID=99658 RepID=A0ABQ8ILJ5_9ROSI|nr:hypothetical protein JRO89_XS01G0268000 [Xanthoceras sorbifolium]
MKVHPAPKTLQRLPHVFDKVLQLPFHSDTNVSVEETSESFLFTATAAGDMINQNVRAHAIEMYPGVTKVVVRRTGGGDFLLDEMELDLWRFRLPATTRPEMASARCCAGELVVIVPKGVISL